MPESCFTAEVENQVHQIILGALMTEYREESHSTNVIRSEQKIRVAPFFFGPPDCVGDLSNITNHSY